jgi:cell division protease FtsH
VDTEARRIIEDCYQQAVTTLRDHRDQLGRLAHALLEGETLDEDDAYAAAGIDRGTAPAAVAAGVRQPTPRRPRTRQPPLAQGPPWANR